MTIRPSNTGQRQTLETLRVVRDDIAGDRAGFQGRRYRTLKLGASSYLDVFDDYLEFLEPRLCEFRRVLKPTGTLYDPHDSALRVAQSVRVVSPSGISARWRAKHLNQNATRH